LSGIEGLYFMSTSYLRFGTSGGLKVIAATTKESTC
jgi:hypothetical protein